MPLWSKIIIRIFLSETDAHFLIGDIEEVYKEYKKRKGKMLGGIWLTFHLIRTLPPIILSNIRWSLSMLKNYIKIALRNIVKNKIYSFVNISGLAIGLASCLIIFLAIANELSFDKFYDNAENIYRIVTESEGPGGLEKNGFSPYMMSDALRNDYPEFKNTAQILWMDGQISVGEKLFKEENIICADSQFFDVFKYHFIAGTAESAKDAPDGVVLTEKLAKKYFGNNSAVGEIIKYDNQLELKVTGVIEDIPAHTHLPVDMIMSSASLNEDMISFNIRNWNVSVSSSQTYFVKPENLSPQEINKYLKNIGDKYLPERRRETDRFFVQPLLDIHLNTEFASINYSTSIDTLIIFGSIGLLILLIASINFINLSTAQSLKRAKEVGVRKVLGAKKLQVISQLMGEVITYTTIAILIAMIITGFILPQVNSFLDNKSELSLFNNFLTLLFLLAIFIFVCVLAGVYPSFVMSKFSPVEAFRSKVFRRQNKTFSLRNSLVVLQFVISQTLIICTIVIYQQMNYLSNKNLGFDKEQVLNLDISVPDEQRAELLRTKLLQNPQIANVTFSSGAPISQKKIGAHFVPDINNPENVVEAVLKPSDEYYLDVFDVKLLAGDNYGQYIQGDTLYKFVINESLSKKLGAKTPGEALGKSLGFSVFNGHVVGVVEDFHTASLHENISPVILLNFLGRYHFQVSIKLMKNASIGTINFIKESWKQVYPEFSYNATFLDEFIQELYEREQQFSTMINIFAGLAIFIGCLGLLGLVSFMAVQRTKEIGLRKVMGATPGGILILLSKELTKWVIAANIIAWPIAYYAMNKWLQDYAYRTEIKIWIFILGGIVSIAIAWLTVAAQSYKASVQNPVDAIRVE